VHGDNLSIRFEVTNVKSELPGTYQGVLRYLFREELGIVARGRARWRQCVQSRFDPAKRDETYMPKEVADALKKTEHWKNDYASKAAMSVGGGTQ